MDQLLASSDATRSKFLELQFLRNRRVKSSSHRSRPWYTNVEQWLEGMRAEQADPGLSFFEEVRPCVVVKATLRHIELTLVSQIE